MTRPERSPSWLRRRVAQLDPGGPIHKALERSLWEPGKKVWYCTQKEHWLGWLREYAREGAYHRKTPGGRSAEFSYNHINCAPMLAWLAEAAGVPGALVVRGCDASAKALPSSSAQSSAFRRVVPWAVVAAQLGAVTPDGPPSTQPRRARSRAAGVEETARPLLPRELLTLIENRGAPGAAREKWINWLREYDEAGYYKRKQSGGRTAAFAYNHLQNPPMLAWLAAALDVPATLVRRARAASLESKTPNPSAQAAAFRRVVPWSIIAQHLPAT